MFILLSNYGSLIQQQFLHPLFARLTSKTIFSLFLMRFQHLNNEVYIKCCITLGPEEKAI